MNLQVEPAGRRGKHILLVEDEATIAEVVLAILSDEGYSVRLASTLDQAVAYLWAEAFDLVLVDGLSSDREQAFANAATVLRAAGATPVVMFTGHRHDPVTARATGFADVITKPFDLDAFTERVRVLLGA